MINPRLLSVQDFTYALPEDRIAKFPLAERDASKLLVYREGGIKEAVYRDIADYLPANSLLIFNNTKVIKARIVFHKSTGGAIEIFCLEPYEMISDYQSVMQRTGSVKWKCLVGGAAKWKEPLLSKKLKLKINSAAASFQEVDLIVKIVEKLPDAFVIEFSWQPANISFAEIIGEAGAIPLPPYIKRAVESADASRYQTIFAKDEGSVAAPTAGLHFTNHIMEQLALKKIRRDFVTLHVGAGTFKPVKATVMDGHEMHAEWMDVPAAVIDNIRSSIGQTIVAVGTTSLRTLESLYWMGVKTLLDPLLEDISLTQWEVYETINDNNTPVDAALTALLQWMEKRKLDRLFTHTQILIAPGYRFRMVNKIVTNFHQPQSTLLLLVAAAVGPSWKEMYQYALDHEFRFLSYGDGCLLTVKEG